MLSEFLHARDQFAELRDNHVSFDVTPSGRGVARPRGVKGNVFVWKDQPVCGKRAGTLRKQQAEERLRLASGKSKPPHIFGQIKISYSNWCAPLRKVHSVAWNCDGTRLASGSYDKTVTLWALDAEKLVSIEHLGGWTERSSFMSCVKTPH